MKCLVVGDLFIPAAVMREKLPAGMFDSVEMLEWGGEDRSAMRNKIRNIETGGYAAEPPAESMAEAIRDCDAIMIHMCPVPTAIIEAAPKLRLIASNRGGAENIDIATATGKGIAVITTPHHNAKAVADYTIGLMLSETRNIARSYQALRNGEWRERFPNSGDIPELNNCRVGLIGFGTIGKLVARRLSGFDIKELLVHDPYVDPAVIAAAGGRPVEKDELFRQSDIISIHSRQPADAPPVAGEAEIALMKRTAILVNTARAVALDMAALTAALQQGRIRGAALDVFPKEPVPADEPILALDTATVTNHRGGDTLNSYLESPTLLSEEMVKFYRGDNPFFFVNPECIGK